VTSLPVTSLPVTLLPLAADHAPTAARLHIQGQPGTFLTSLGPEALTALYAALPTTRAGFGFAAQDADGQIAGFISATTGVGSLFVEIGTTQLGLLLPPLLRQYARHPGLLLRSAQTVLYPLLARHAAGPPAAELLSIMVEPARRSQGVGATLLDALTAACRARGLALLDVTVDAQNRGAQHFYARHGFQPHHTFTLYGRPMRALRLCL
jgi:ribosomal protein S18 acetylase RimI-like enzyme